MHLIDCQFLCTYQTLIFHQEINFTFFGTKFRFPISNFVFVENIYMSGGEKEQKYINYIERTFYFKKHE